MRNKHNPWVLVVLLMAGTLAGSLAGEFLSQLPYMKWISFGGIDGYRNLFSFSMQPALDLRALKLGLDFSLSVNAGSILGMILGLIAYIRI